MKNVKGKPITYADWLRVAKFYGGESAVERVKAFMETRFARSGETVEFSESKLFGLIVENEPEDESTLDTNPSFC